MTKPRDSIYTLYNLFPRVVGHMGQWPSHLERAAQLGFDWILLNPLYKVGRSGSLYAVHDFDGVDPAIVDPDDARSPWVQVHGAVGVMHGLGMKVMMDLVVGQIAIDSPLVSAKPEWFSYAESGELVHPGAWKGNRKVQTWTDVAQVANAGSADKDGLWQHWTHAVERLVDLGADGIRCHAAYQVPGGLWRHLMERARAKRPDIVFAADTLGCPDWRAVEVARVGFDLCFNSVKWWNFHDSWCLDQYRALAPYAGTIGFPESHDTRRLLDTLEGDIAAVQLRYLFVALFSTGVMVPVGFERGTRVRLDVKTSRPEDLGAEEHPVLASFVRAVNDLKRAAPVFREDNPIERVHQPGHDVVALKKTSHDGRQRGLVVLNLNRKDPARAFLPGLRRVLECESVRDVTPGREPGPAVKLMEMLEPSGFRVYLSDSE